MRAPENEPDKADQPRHEPLGVQAGSRRLRCPGDPGTSTRTSASGSFTANGDFYPGGLTRTRIRSWLSRPTSATRSSRGCGWRWTAPGTRAAVLRWKGRAGRRREQLTLGATLSLPAGRQQSFKICTAQGWPSEREPTFGRWPSAGSGTDWRILEALAQTRGRVSRRRIAPYGGDHPARERPAAHG